MPFYEIQHSVPLTSEQRSALAKGITTLYNQTFNAPSLFVNIRFMPIQDEDYYSGGEKTSGTNRIFVQTRGGEGRSAEVFDKLAEDIEAIWDRVIDGKAPLSGVFIMPGLIAREHGFAVPKVGDDAKWLQENWDKFVAMADKGDRNMMNLIAEVKNKPSMLEKK